MSGILIRRALAVSALGILCALAGRALAAGNGNTGAGTRTTTFVSPTWSNNSQQCIWTHTITPHNRDEPDPDDPTDNCVNGTKDGYAAAIADGMQIWAYAWAKDTCTGSVAVASSAGSAGGKATLTFVQDAGQSCSPQIQVDWKPRFKVRAEMNSDPAGALGAGYMKGDCVTLNVHPLAKGGEESTSGTETQSITIDGHEIPISHSETDESTVQDFQWQKQALATETASWSSSTKIKAWADAHLFNWWAEAQAFVWDSKPGLKMKGDCTNCVGTGIIMYGWYN